jgi:hypothetical protein
MLLVQQQALLVLMAYPQLVRFFLPFSFQLRVLEQPLVLSQLACLPLLCFFLPVSFK